jgi:hypothetical protein
VSTDGPAAEAAEAINKGIAALPGLGVDASAYQLIGAHSEAVSRDADPFRWKLDFKTTSSMPTRRGGKIGKGGELSIEVDLETGEVKKLRGGD